MKEDFLFRTVKQARRAILSVVLSSVFFLIPFIGGFFLYVTEVVQAQTTYTLSINKTGSGAVASTVSSNPVGISCGVDCGEAYSAGTSVVLTATAGSGGYVFSGWSGGGCSGTGTCTVVLNADTTVTADFDDAVVYYTVTVSKTGDGAGASTVMSDPSGITCGADCSESYAYGTNVSLIANPAPGYAFLGWTGCLSASANVCTISINNNASITANFGVADASGRMTGWGWSSNTGWISFHCDNLGECGTANYGLSFVNNGLSGYAWGGHMGWIYFPTAADGNASIGLSDCPGPNPCNPPSVNPTTGAVTGWARFLSGVGRTDGWAGWVDLSGVTYNSTTGAVTGYAWGGPVVGWISFNGFVVGGLCDYSLSVSTPSVSITSGQIANNTVTATIPGAGGGSVTYYCDKNVYLWPGNDQYDTALFECGTVSPHEAPIVPGDGAVSECARFDDPICFNWTLSQWIDSTAMIYYCGVGNYTKLSSSSFRCNAVGIACSVDLSISSIVQQTTAVDVKDSQFGAKSLTPATVSSAVPNSSVSITSLLTTPTDVYNVIVTGLSNTGIVRSAQFAVTVAGSGTCQDPSGWSEVGKAACPSDSTGFTGSVSKSLVNACSAPAGSAPKCQYTCAPNYTRQGTTNVCYPSPVLNVRAGPAGSANLLEVTSDAVGIGDSAVVQWKGQNVTACTGVGGDSHIGGTWDTPKNIGTSYSGSQQYTSVPLTLDGASSGADCPSGADQCYDFKIECSDFGGNIVLTTVEVPLTSLGWNTPRACALYDNPFGTGAPLTTVSIGTPVYWVASSTPDTALDGSLFIFEWAGSENLDLDVATHGTCEGFACNSVRKVYKTTGSKDARVTIREGGPAIQCGPVYVNTVINQAFREF